MSDLRKIYSFELFTEGLGVLKFAVLADDEGEAKEMVAKGLRDAVGQFEEGQVRVNQRRIH